MTTPKPKKLKTVKGRGYVGVWNDGVLGFCLPPHLETNRIWPTSVPPHLYIDEGDEYLFLCEITIKPVYRNGKLVRRKIK